VALILCDRTQAWLIVAYTFPGLISKVTTNLKQQIKSPVETFKNSNLQNFTDIFYEIPKSQ
jgi:hypothetical protein